MFRLSETEANALHAKFHELAIEAAQSGKTDRAEAMQEAAKMLHEAQLREFDRRTSASRRRRQRELQAAS